MISFVGRITSGRGEAAGFTRLDWVRERFIHTLGIDPYPGTVNLTVGDDDAGHAWSALRSRPGYSLSPPTEQSCAARCYAVRVNGRLPAGVVVPEVPGYPDGQVEIVAALNLRRALLLADGDPLAVEASDPLQVRAVIFDVDGTLVDSLTVFRRVAERAAGPHGITITDAHVRDALNTSQSFWELALPADHMDRAATMEALTRDAARLWPAVLRECGRVFPDVADMLRSLRERGFRLGIMTGARRGSLELLREAHVIEMFDAVITGDQVERPKPDPQGLVACATKLDVAPEDAVYVGDTPLDIQAARAAGMSAIGMLTGAGDSALLSAAGPNFIVAEIGRVSDLLRAPL